MGLFGSSTSASNQTPAQKLVAENAPATPAAPTSAASPAQPPQAATATQPSATPAAQATPTSAQDDPDIQTVDGPMRGKYRVKVIRSKCIAATSCVAIAPKVFEMDQDNIAKVISQDELDDIKLLAAQSCPTMAIVVEDIETGQQVWPMM